MSFFLTQFARKNFVLAAAVTALFTQGASAAGAPTNEGTLQYGLTTGLQLFLAGVNVAPSGKTTQSGGFLTPTEFDFPVSSITTSANKLTKAQFSGAGLTFSKGGKTDTYTNLSLDVASKTVFASQVGGASNVALFTGASVSGGYAAGSFSYTVSGLGLASQALTLISGKLGASRLLLDLVPFGSLNIQAVPEPSSYALFGLGLAGAACVARRRRAA